LGKSKPARGQKPVPDLASHRTLFLRAEGEMFLPTLGCIKAYDGASIYFYALRATKKHSALSNQFF
jgi:hypothetical protein